MVEPNPQNTYTLCYICSTHIPQSEPYFVLERFFYIHKSGNDYFEKGIPVLFACQNCIDLVALGHAYYDGFYPLLNIELDRLAKCVLAIHKINVTEDIVKSCSICDRDIEFNSRYTKLCLDMEVNNGEGIIIKSMVPMAVLCKHCDVDARKAPQLCSGSRWIEEGIPGRKQNHTGEEFDNPWE